MSRFPAEGQQRPVASVSLLTELFWSCCSKSNMLSSRVWKVLLIGVISLSRIGMGIYNSLSGPTLLYLSGNVDVSVTLISTVFSARSIGILLGAVIGGIFKRIVGPDFRHLLTLGAGVGIMGLMDLAVPWITEFGLLVCVIIVGGMMYGYLDSGLQALLLQLWGEKASRPNIQLFHFMFSVGAFIAPLLAAPFLAMANEQSSEDSCPGSDKDSDFTTYSTILNESSTVTPPPNFNPVGWTYVIAAGWLVFVSLLMMALSLCNVERKVSASLEQSGMSSEDRKEEPLRDVIWLFLIIAGYYFCGTTVSNVFFNFIYSVTLCSDLSFSVTQATQINSVYWLGLGLGRLSGVAAANFLQPRTIIIICISGSIIDMIIMCIWGESTAWVAWTVSGLHGYMTSLLYPTCVSWLSQITNISGTYQFIFSFGTAIGSLTMLPLAGYLFDLDPFSVMYLVLGLACGCAVFYGMALYVGKRHTVFLLKKTRALENDDLKDEAKEDLSEKATYANEKLSYDNEGFDITEL